MIPIKMFALFLRATTGGPLNKKSKLYIYIYVERERESSKVASYV